MLDEPFEMSLVHFGDLFGKPATFQPMQYDSTVCIPLVILWICNGWGSYMYVRSMFCGGNSKHIAIITTTARQAGGLVCVVVAQFE